MLKRIRNVRVFSKLALVIILLIFTITLVYMIILTQVSAKVIRNETRSSNVIFLNKLNRLVENELSAIDRIIVQFYADNIESRNITDEIQDSYQRYILYKNFKEKLFRNYDFIDSVYIYHDQGSKVYFMKARYGDSGTQDTGSFFDSKVYDDFIMNGSLPRIIGARMLEPNYFDRKAADWEKSRVISFVKSIPVISPHTKDAIVVNINEEHLINLVSSNYMPRRSIVLVIDRKGDSVLSYYQTANDPIKLEDTDIKRINGLQRNKDGISTFAGIRISGESCYITALKSDLGDRVYLLIMPEKELFKPITRVNLTIFILSNLVLIVGVIISTLIDKKFFQPVLVILQILKSRGVEKDVSVPGQTAESGNKKKKDEFKQIEGYIESMISRNVDQERQLQNYFAHYKEKMLFTLLNGDSGTITLLNEDIIIFNKEFKSFGVILVNLLRKDTGAAGADGNCAFFLDLMVNGLSEYGRVERIHLKQQEFIFLLCMESEIPEQELTNFTRDLLKDSRCQAFNYYVCIGGVCDSVQNVHQSFKEADSLLQYFRKAEQTGVYNMYSMAASPNKDHALNTSSRELVDKVIKYINTHYMEDIGLNIIADYVYLSPSYLGRIFKEISGYSFTDYLVKVRMETAADMLINKNINVNDISSRVGYCSAQSFSRLFRNYFSCSPSEYRRKNAEKILEKG